MEVGSGWIVGDDWGGASLQQEATEGIGIIGHIGGAKPWWGQRCEQGLGGANVTQLALGDGQCDGPSERIADRVDLGGAASTRASDRLALRPPFPPAAERCAFAEVLSMAWKSSSGDTLHRASNNRRQTARPDQRFQRL
jgi:hypothetical protein